MARKGNLNELKHAAAVVRDRFRRRGEREAAAILKAARLQDDPLARLVVRQIGRLEAKVARLQEHHDRRGHFNKAGDLKPSVLTEAKFIGDLLGEARRLFEEIRQQGAALPAGLVYRCELADGTPAFAVEASVVPELHEEPPAFAATSAQEERSVEHRQPSIDRPRIVAPAPARREPTDAERYGWIPWIGGEDDF